jgi:signal transduction protein with GAF and PtsI domain
MDSSGLRVLVSAADRLRRGGTRLVLRAPSAPVIRLLEISEVGGVVGVEPRAWGGPTRDEEALMSALTQVAAIPAGRDMIDATLSAVVALAAAAVAPADGVSLTLLRHGRLVTAAATDDTILRLDELQYVVAQGPCVDAATQGQRFHVESIEGEQRWPAFTPHVSEQGFHSILSTPLVTSTQSVGALNLYARRTSAFDIGQQQLASLFAAQAAAVVGHGAVELTVEQIVVRLQAALQAREVIAQAQGALMAQTGATVDQARTVLRKRSRDTSIPLVEQARLVIGATQGPSHD